MREGQIFLSGPRVSLIADTKLYHRRSLEPTLASIGQRMALAKGAVARGRVSTDLRCHWGKVVIQGRAI